MIKAVDNAEQPPREDPDLELRNRIAMAKLERQRIAEEREQRESAKALERELEAEERALKNEKAINAAEAEHGPLGGKIAAVQTGQGVVIVKRPHPNLFRRFMDAGKVTTEECEKLVRPSLVYPDKTTFDQWCEDEPAILLRVADAAAVLAGVRGKELAGK